MKPPARVKYILQHYHHHANQALYPLVKVWRTSDGASIMLDAPLSNVRTALADAFFPQLGYCPWPEVLEVAPLEIGARSWKDLRKQSPYGEERKELVALLKSRKHWRK